ncbi:MAG: hypothetical protein V7K50_14830 [Nostoc sp.]
MPIVLGGDRFKQLQPISPHFSRLLKDTNLSIALSGQDTTLSFVKCNRC